VWACDPVGSFLFIVSATLMLLALDWAGGVYPWHDAHVVAPLTIGLASLVLFALYGELSSIKSRGENLLTLNRRMERERRRISCTCLLPRWTEFCTLSLCFRC